MVFGAPSTTIEIDTSSQMWPVLVECLQAIRAAHPEVA